MASQEQECDTYKEDKSEIKNQQALESEEFKQDFSSMYSSMSSSNFTMSCSVGDEQEEIEPSTSGCSSLLAHRHKKGNTKERVKEYLKELKSIIQPSTGGRGRMGTLSTLQHVLSSMRKMKEGKTKSKINKKSLPSLPATFTDEMAATQCDMMHTVYESDSPDSLTNESLKSSDELKMVLSTSDHIVQSVSGNMKFVLGYPKETWIGRSLDDYIHKRDLITFNSLHRNEGDSDSCSPDTESKTFYFRLRKFKCLGNSGFSLRKQDIYIPFQCMFMLKKMTATELNKEGTTYSSSWFEEMSTSGNSGCQEAMVPVSPSPPEVNDCKRLYTILYCVPLVSPYLGNITHLPEVKSFETRHTLFCSYCHVQPNTVPLLGYLPQEMVGVSIFDFYHNDELSVLFNIYQKVISLNGVPYRGYPIRLRAKNGSWIECETEWSSFVNPWTKRLEFIIGKHTVIKGPENRDVFSENFDMPLLEETPETVLQARQKIKDLLLLPLESVYVGSSQEKSQAKGKGKTVVISDPAEEIPKQAEPVSETKKHNTIYPHDLEKPKLHTTGLIFKTASISRAYNQLNYTNGIKKFLLSQPRWFISDSDVKKGSLLDNEKEKLKRERNLEKWMHNFDNILPPSSIQMTSADSRNMPSFNDEYWKKTIIINPDTDFDFDISIPSKPPSFGSSTKVLVSEQEHRDNDNSLDPMGLREILQVPSSSSHNVEMIDPPSTTSLVSSENQKSLRLTRDTLMKHTVLQEQLYLATASPDRNIVFISESQNHEKEILKRQRRSLKRSHSPDHSSAEPCKSGRHSEDVADTSTVAILNPSFPLLPTCSMSQPNENIHKSSCRVPVSVHIFPIVTYMTSSLSESVVYTSDQRKMMSTSGEQQLPYYISDNQVMVGFQQSTMLHTGLTGNSLPVPVQQLNSDIMQQASVSQSLALNRKKQDKTDIQQTQYSTEESSSEDICSSLYLLESENKIKMTYHELIMQSLAQQMSPQGKGLNSAPWLEMICFTDNLQMKYHMPNTRHKSKLKEDRQSMEKLVQPELVFNQLHQLLSELESCSVSPMDEELDYMLFPFQKDTPDCGCAEFVKCGQCNTGDHGISKALKVLRKSTKKEKRSRKTISNIASSSSSSTVNDLSNIKEDVVEIGKSTKEDVRDTDDMDIAMESEECFIQHSQSANLMKSKSSSCSCKSDSGEGDIQCDISMDSLNAFSELTPSDQRSNNELGSSMKESDADAMSKKSDCSSDKQHASEFESECKVSDQNDAFNKLFTSLDVCFPHLHKANVPWLVNANFTNKVKMQYQLEISDKEATLQRDRERLQTFDEPVLIHKQFNVFKDDLCRNDNIKQSSKLCDKTCTASSSEGKEASDQGRQLEGRNLMAEAFDQHLVDDEFLMHLFST